MKNRQILNSLLLSDIIVLFGLRFVHAIKLTKILNHTGLRTYFNKTDSNLGADTFEHIKTIYLSYQHLNLQASHRPKNPKKLTNTLKNPIPQYEILTPSPTKYTPSKYTENAKLQGPLCGETCISVSSIRQLKQKCRDRCRRKDDT